MTFSDEKIRDWFHKSATLLQIVGNMFDSFAMLYGREPEMLAVMSAPGEHTLLLEIQDIELAQAYELVSKVNAQFPRRDRKTQTASVIDEESVGFELYVTQAKDFEGLH